MENFFIVDLVKLIHLNRTIQFQIAQIGLFWLAISNMVQVQTFWYFPYKKYVEETYKKYFDIAGIHAIAINGQKHLHTMQVCPVLVAGVRFLGILLLI